MRHRIRSLRACEVGRLTFVEKLCEEHSELLAMTDKRGLSPLHVMASDGLMPLEPSSRLLVGKGMRSWLRSCWRARLT